jgi:hypothetical protein
LYNGAEGGYQFTHGPEVSTDKLREYFPELGDEEWETLESQLAVYEPFFLDKTAEYGTAKDETKSEKERVFFGFLAGKTRALCSVCQAPLSDDGHHSNVVWRDQFGVLWMYYNGSQRYPHHTVACETRHVFLTVDARIVGPIEAHQARVVVEKEELDGKIERLRAFIAGDTFGGLSEAEQRRLRRQEAIMGLYSDVLDERIMAVASVSACTGQR